MNSAGVTIWFTGLSGAGKTTLANLLAPELEAHGHSVEKLDGDVVRAHLSKGLGFSKEDRDTNVRRIGWVAALGTRLGGTMLVSAISPYRDVRREVRAMTPAFFEVYVQCPLDELVRRDPKGLYKKALAGEIARQVRLGNADVAVPVRNEDQEVVGAVHLSQQLTQVTNRLTILRWTVWGAVSAGLLVSVSLSFALSRSLNQPLERLTRASRAVNFDAPPSRVKEEGPTEVRTLARTFNEMSERLYELEQGRRRLLSAVVHELGRPLGAIKAAAQVMGQNGKDTEMVVELSSGIDDQVDQLRRLLDDLALLARNDIQNLVLDIVPTDVGELVLEECRRYDPRIREKEIELITDFSPNRTQAAADPMRLSQIIGNLLDNAIKYTPNGGQIRIVVGGEADRTVLTIEDSGPGIDPSELERIFDFLYRSPRQERVREGMGIGLALSRRLAEAQGGTLTAHHRAEGTGAKLVLSLPNELPQTRLAGGS